MSEGALETSVDSPAANAGAPVPRPFSARTIIAGAVFSLIVVASAVVLVGVALSQEPPSWWGTIDRNDPDAIAAAQRVENGAATQLTLIRDHKPEDGDSSKPWTVALKATDANAWLATRLAKWLESQDGEAFRWPAELDQVQVHFDAGEISVGASIKPLTPDSRPQVLSASLRPSLHEDGSLWLPARWVSLGRLDMPASLMISSSSAPPGTKVPQSLKDLPQMRDMLAIFSGRSAAMRQPIIRIGDGRRVQLLGLEARDGVLLITCRTLPREDRRATRDQERRPASLP